MYLEKKNQAGSIKQALYVTFTASHKLDKHCMWDVTSWKHTAENIKSFNGYTC